MYPFTTFFSFICVVAFAQTSVEPSGTIFISKDQGVNWERADKGIPAGVSVNAWIVNDGSVIAGTNTRSSRGCCLYRIAQYTLWDFSGSCAAEGN